MSDSGIVNTTERYIAQLERRVENLERRAPSLVTPEPEFGCCALYCCEEEPFFLLDDIGESHVFCSTDVDEQSTGMLRLLVTGAFVYIAAGTGAMNLLWNVQVAGTNYAPNFQDTFAVTTGDQHTKPFHGVVDAAVSPVNVCLFIQNLAATDVRIQSVSLSVQVFTTEEGSVSCGTILGS